MVKKIKIQKGKWIALACIGAILSACAGSSGGGSGGDNSAGAGGTVQSKGYYQELLAKPVGDCDHLEDLQFQVLANLQMDKFGVADDGRDLVVHLLLSLKDDGTYTAIYSEEKVVSARDSGVSFQNQFSKNISGAYQVVNGTRLILNGLGVANKLEIGHQKKIQLKIHERVHDARVNSLMIVLEKTLTSLGPDGESLEQYCERK